MRLIKPEKGSVSAVFHEIWDPNRGIVHKYIIHVDPKEKNIKITPLNPAYGRTKIVIDGLDMPLGLAVDPYSNNVYWTDQGTFSIGVASLEAALKGQIKSNKRLYTSKYLGVPRYIAVDPIRRALYWSERQDDWERIHKSDILGKSQDIIWHEFGTLDIGSISVELRSAFKLILRR